MFYGIKRLFENFKYIQLITVEKPLSLDKEKLMKLAKEFLNYNRETKVQEKKKKKVQSKGKFLLQIIWDIQAKNIKKKL